MSQVYFHCSGNRRVLIDQCAAEVDDLTEAREDAGRVVQLLITAPNLEDWRDWALHISDDFGDKIFVVPFSAVLGKPCCRAW